MASASASHSQSTPSSNAGSGQVAGKVAVYNVGAHTADAFASRHADFLEDVAKHMVKLASAGVEVIVVQALRGVDCE